MRGAARPPLRQGTHPAVVLTTELRRFDRVVSGVAPRNGPREQVLQKCQFPIDRHLATTGLRAVAFVALDGKGRHF